MSHFEMHFRAEYIDTDAMGIVHHASYWRWFERARVEWLRHMGMPYGALEAEGWGLPLRDAAIEYHQPLRFDDEATVHLSLGEMAQSTIRLDYRILKQGRLVVAGSTTHVACRRSETEGSVKWAPRRIPNEWREKWQQLSAKKS